MIGELYPITMHGYSMWLRAGAHSYDRFSRRFDAANIDVSREEAVSYIISSLTRAELAEVIVDECKIGSTCVIADLPSRLTYICKVYENRIHLISVLPFEKGKWAVESSDTAILVDKNGNANIVSVNDSNYFYNKTSQP